MSRIVATPTLTFPEFALAADGLRSIAIIDVALDVVIYADGDWEIERVGLMDDKSPFGVFWLGPSARLSLGYLHTHIIDAASEITANEERVASSVADFLKTGRVQA